MFMERMDNQIPMKRKPLDQQGRAMSEPRTGVMVAKIERTVAKTMAKPSRKARR